MKLYDMEKEEWRETHFNPGDRWRVNKIYHCDICGCESNEFHMRGGMYWAPRLVCNGNNDNSDLHDLLKEKLQQSRTRKHPQGYLSELKQEIESIRKNFRDVSPNIEGMGLQKADIDGHFG
ncbi:hypothetical protein ACFLTW_01690 [Chloroflexota bacterium]